MTLQEKSLYHQIHPTKLFTDWSMALIALYPFWHHHLIIALLIAFVPSMIVGQFGRKTFEIFVHLLT